MNGKKPDRREIKLNITGGRIIEDGIIDAEVVDAYLGDNGEGDVLVTRKVKGRPDCAHYWAEPYAVCACSMVYCKICYYHHNIIRYCGKGHMVGPCCYRKSFLFSGKLVCRVCGAYLLDSPKLPERKA